MPLFAEFNTSHLFLMGLLATSGIILFQTQRKMRLGTIPTMAPARKPPLHPAHRGRAPTGGAELRAWQAQMQDLSQDVAERIDGKLAELEQRTRAAHHEALRLEAAIAAARSILATHDAPPTSTLASETVSDEPPVSQAQALQVAVRSFDRPSGIPAPKSKAALERPVAQIYALADTGLDGRGIAERVGAPVGEVELILGLRRK